MIVVERRNLLKEILFREGLIRVSDAARRFGVSEETIRRDLNRLEREGLAHKNYGGAVLVEGLKQTMQEIPPVNQRRFENSAEKTAIGQKAAELVIPGNVVVMDAGSTVWSVAKQIRAIPDISIITNGLDVVNEVANTEIPVMMLGGKLIRKSMCFVGPQSENLLQNYNADIAFIGASGVSPSRGFIAADIFEAEVKRSMASVSAKVVLVCDHTKFLRGGMIAFCTLQDVDYLVTSDLADPAIVGEIERQGVKVLRCSVPESEKPPA